MTIITTATLLLLGLWYPSYGHQVAVDALATVTVEMARKLLTALRCPYGQRPAILPLHRGPCQVLGAGEGT